jgi:PIN domain nuclease of toxin-antitoxin system
MIILDTHIWLWWVHDEPQLTPSYKEVVEAHENRGLGISAISYWEVAKLVENERIQLPLPLEEWMAQALAYPGIELIELSPQIAIASTQLPQPFHRDPAVKSSLLLPVY